MARKITWSSEATEDIDAIAEYISRDSTSYSSAFVQEVLEVGASLDKLSERGRIVPELGYPNIRELFVKGYRLLYKVEKDRIVILGLVHGKREIEWLRNIIFRNARSGKPLSARPGDLSRFRLLRTQ